MLLEKIKSAVQPVSGNEENAIQEHLLNVILVSFISLAIVFILVGCFTMIPQYNTWLERILSIANSVISLGLYLCAFILSKKGLWRLSSTILIGYIFLLCIIAPFAGLAVISAYLCFLLAVTSSVFLNPAGTISLTSFCIIAQAAGYYHPIPALTKIHYPPVFVSFLALFTILPAVFILKYYSRLLYSSLIREKKQRNEHEKQEAELHRHKENLEGLVKQRTAELETAAARLQLASQAKSAFLSNMSHEIRTPLNGILGITELLKSGRLDEEQQEMIRTLQTSGDHLLSIINDILDISQIESGKMKLHPEPFSPEKLIRDCFEILKPSADEKNLEFTLALSDDLPELLFGDPGRVRQIILNVAGNGIKYTSQGRVRINVHSSEAGNTATLYFKVEDTGMGIDPEKKDSIFGRFSQADSSSTRQHGGAGLGLAISRELIEMMDGTISFESKPGICTTFSFMVRLASNSDPREPRETPVRTEHAIRSSLLGKRVLVVEDNVLNGEVLKKILEHLGFSASVSKTGPEGVSFCSQNSRPDIVFMDCQMPSMDGFEATRLIRENENKSGLPAIPIIAFSGDILQETQDKCLAAGMNGFLSKPLRKAAIIDVLNNFL